MSSLFIHIETATEMCSVALSRGKEVIALRESSEKNIHASMTAVFVNEVFEEVNLKPDDLQAVVVSKGPGSYTGLRIGVSTAKGLCYALDKPLIAVETLQAMAKGLLSKKSEDALYCPMIDARRMEVYSALFNRNNEKVRATKAEIIDERSFAEYLIDQKIIFFGNGAPKCKAMLGDHPNAIFVDDFKPSAKYLIEIALEKYQIKQFEDTAYFEPFYLKDFVAGKPRVKGL